MVRRVLSGCALAMVVASPGTAAAQNFLFGYQFGLVQTIGPRISNDPTIIDDDLGAGTATAAGSIANLTRLDVINLDTAVTANVTMDFLGQIMNHGLVLGAQLNQTVPTAVVENAVAETADDQTGFVLNANYLGRIERPTWGLAIGGGYALTEDGRLGLGADGTAGGDAAGSLPTAPLGPFRVNAIQHDVNAQVTGQLTRPNWDLVATMTYNFNVNGAFAFANGDAGQGAAGQGAAAVNPTTNNLAYVLVDANDIGLDLAHRHRFNRRNNLNSNVNVAYLVPGPDPVVILRGQVCNPNAPDATPDCAALQGAGLERTLAFTFGEQYLYNVSGEQNFGIDAQAIFSMRDPLGADNMTLGMRGDTFIWQIGAVYNDFIRAAELNIAATLGVAQPTLFLPPQGAIPAGRDIGDFSSVRAGMQPVATLQLQRRFEPFDLALNLARQVDLGVLGASAVITTGGGVNVNYAVDIGDTRRLNLNAGVNAAKIEGVGADLFRGIPNIEQFAAQVEANTVAGVFTAGMGLFEVGGLVADLALNYTVNWLDNDPNRLQLRIGEDENNCGVELTPDPNGGPGTCVGLSPVTTHTGLLTFRLLWGRGTLSGATGAGGGGGGPAGGIEGADQFAQDPRNGSPLTTARLTAQGARFLDGAAGSGPGRQPRSTSGQQRLQQSQRQAEVEQQALSRGQVASTSQTVQQAEEEAAEDEARRRRRSRGKRTRSFEPPPDDYEDEDDDFEFEEDPL